MGYLLDLNVGDGKTCLAGIMRGISVVGIAFNDAHRENLYEYLEAEIFKAMQDASSPLYESALTALLGKKKRKNDDVIRLHI